MIKIKDNIINENKIIQISINEDNNLEIDIEHSFPIVIKDATFDDIEWNYDKNNIHEEYVISQLKEYENKLNKVSRFIVKNAIASDKWEEIEPLEFAPVGNIIYKSLSKNKVQELYKILRGK